MVEYLQKPLDVPVAMLFNGEAEREREMVANIKSALGKKEMIAFSR